MVSDGLDIISEIHLGLIDLLALGSDCGFVGTAFVDFDLELTKDKALSVFEEYQFVQDVIEESVELLVFFGENLFGVRIDRLEVSHHIACGKAGRLEELAERLSFGFESHVSCSCVREEAEGHITVKEHPLLKGSPGLVRPSKNNRDSSDLKAHLNVLAKSADTL